LRCNLASFVTGLSFREFSIRVAESSLLQWFLHHGEVDRVKAPSKSALECYHQWVSAATMTAVHQQLLTAAVTPARAAAPQPLHLAEPIDATEVFFDSTCLKANIHFPVDWGLLRDAARTLMKATVLIRRTGLKQRMPQEPLLFLSAMNKLTMAMSANRRRADAKKQRKRIFRQMKTLEKTIARHAQARRDLLAQRWAETELSEKQTQVILRRLDHSLAQLPAVERLRTALPSPLQQIWGDRGRHQSLLFCIRLAGDAAPSLRLRVPPRRGRRGSIQRQTKRPLRTAQPRQRKISDCARHQKRTLPPQSRRVAKTITGR